MPLYCKISVKGYGDTSDAPAKATLGDLEHESKRLVAAAAAAGDCKPDPLLFSTPQQWHKVFIDELLRPEGWAPLPDRQLPFAAGDILRLCAAAEAKFREEPTLLEVQAPVKVFGDIHGQFSDLLHLFRAFGSPSRLGDIGCLDYLFLGDYVDRGPHSLETICLLFALKVEYPGCVHLLRGNHEVAEVNQRYGFLEECRARLGRLEGWRVWCRINQVFDWLPLAARISSRILCMHGGISEELVSCKQIAAISRPLPLDDFSASNQLAHRLLWSDPNATDAVCGSHASPRWQQIRTFSAQQVEAFCQGNGLELIIRAHKCVRDGFERFARGRLITVFSAANYCGTFDNAGALLMVGRDHVVVPKVIHPRPPGRKDTAGVPQPAPTAQAAAEPSSPRGAVLPRGGADDEEAVARPAGAEQGGGFGRQEGETSSKEPQDKSRDPLHDLVHAAIQQTTRIMPPPRPHRPAPPPPPPSVVEEPVKEVKVAGRAAETRRLAEPSPPAHPAAPTEAATPEEWAEVDLAIGATETENPASAAASMPGTSEWQPAPANAPAMARDAGDGLEGAHTTTNVGEGSLGGHPKGDAATAGATAQVHVVAGPSEYLRQFSMAVLGTFLPPS